MNSNLPSGDLVIRPAANNDIPFIQQIAYETWPIAYKGILESRQMEYMLNLFYSTTSLQQQMQGKHHFYLAIKEFLPIGFASFSQEETDLYKIQKLYVLPGLQKTGAGIQLLFTIETVVKSLEGKKLALNVNRSNPAFSFYTKHGFQVVREEDIDIGQGYFMNDYVMEKELI